MFTMRPEVEFAMAEEALAAIIGFGLRTPISVSKQSTETRKPEPSKPLQGLVIFNEIWPKQLGFFDRPAGKKPF